MAINLGILSTARINQAAILDPASESGSANVIAVAARDGERARSYADEHGIPRAYSSYEELLADPDVDAVYVSVPNSLHAEWAIRALDQGKHVLCEKPFSSDSTMAVKAFALAEANGLLMMEAFMYRHHPQTKAVTDAIESGVIGEPRFVRAVFAFNAVRVFGESNIRFANDLGGGALLDTGSYCVSNIRLICGEPVQVYGKEYLGPTGVDLAFSGTLDFSGGMLTQFACALATERRFELEVIGTGGRLLVKTPWRIEEPGIDIWVGGEQRHVDIEAVNPYRLQLDNFCAAVSGDEPPLLDREDTVGQARVLEALRASAKSEQPVAIST